MPFRPAEGSYRPPVAPPVAAQVRAASADPGDQDARLSQFLSRYPVDERAADFLSQSPSSVVDRVMATFQPKREGESDYSAIVMSFTKRCREQERGYGAPVGAGYGDEYGAPAWKRARYEEPGP